MSGRVLVTGAGGFLGSHICSYFGQQGYHIALVDRSSIALETVSLYPNLWKVSAITLPHKAFVDVVNEFQPTLLVHCAGTASVRDSVNDPYGDFQGSVEVCAFALETLRKYAPHCRFALLSSAAVYGNPGTLPITEGAPFHPISPYGYHKYICETLAEEYQALHGIIVVIMRIFSAYGERLRKQVIFDLCRKFSDPNTDSVEVFGTGDETRDFIHAHDVARAIACIHNGGASGVFNVASGIQTRISDLVNLIQDCLQSEKAVRYSGSTRPGDPVCWQADITRLSALNYRHQIAFGEGVKAYCRWFASSFGRYYDSKSSCWHTHYRGRGLARRHHLH